MFRRRVSQPHGSGKPNFGERRDFLHEFEGVVAFGHEGVGPGLIGPVEVLIENGASENNDGYEVPRGPAAQPVKEFEAVHAWHFEIEENDVWPRKVGAIGAAAAGKEVVARFEAVAGLDNGVVE